MKPKEGFRTQRCTLQTVPSISASVDVGYFQFRVVLAMPCLLAVMLASTELDDLDLDTTAMLYDLRAH